MINSVHAVENDIMQIPRDIIPCILWQKKNQPKKKYEKEKSIKFHWSHSEYQKEKTQEVLVLEEKLTVMYQACIFKRLF